MYFHLCLVGPELEDTEVHSRHPQAPLATRVPEEKGVIQVSQHLFAQSWK